MPDEIRLDKKMFEALSSDTRRKILVGLSLHPLTVSDLSRQIGIQKSTAYEHLQILMDVELVYKKESNNEFVYYDLTEKGKALTSQKSHTGYKIYILLASTAILLLAGLFEISVFLMKTFNPGLGVNEGVPQGPTNVSMIPIELLIGLSLMLIGLIILYYLLSSIRSDN